MKYLLDTHIFLWWIFRDTQLKSSIREILDNSENHPLGLSQFSLWEIATLHSLKRIELDYPLEAWLEATTAEPTVRLLPLSPAIAAETARLPDTFHRDPADRVIVATARVMRLELITVDKAIRASKLAKMLHP